MLAIAISFTISATVATLVFTPLTADVPATRLGLAMTYSFILPYFLSVMSIIVSVTKIMLTSLERLLEYTELPQEPPHALPDDPTEASWPTKGAIEFKSVSMRYRPGLPLALREVSFAVGGGVKVGVVGRTGAGKSSLMALIFRLVESESGKIVIDGKDHATLGLRALRSCISIIPQDPVRTMLMQLLMLLLVLLLLLLLLLVLLPVLLRLLVLTSLLQVLMEGSVQHNLDPFNEKSGAECASALSKASLSEEMLQTNVEKGGSNLSVGERQLIALARTLLHRKKLVVLDEPTAAVDSDTDLKVQAMIANEFDGTTVLCIAHRLNTIIGVPHDLRSLHALLLVLSCLCSC